MVPDRIRVVLADPQELFRDALAARLESQPSVDLTGSTTDSDELIQLCRRDRPDIVITEVSLTGRGTFDALETLLSERPQTKVILLSGHSSDIFIGYAVRLGVAAYVLKDETFERLLSVIQQVAAGDSYYSPTVKDRIYYDAEEERYMTRIESDLALLTNRQLEVLRHLARGDSVKEIAKQMHLSQKSVDSHKYRIMNKLGIHDRVELARFAIREGLMLP